MQIYIDNKPAVIKQGTSFDYVAENPLFSGAEGYSLTITLPLRGCLQNQAIFGHINRHDVLVKDILLNGSIVDRNLTKHGSFAITEKSELEVKVQFLEGRSEQNYNATFDKVYINELNLGTYPEKSPGRTLSTLPAFMWNPNNFTDDIDGDPRCVALPYHFKSSNGWDDKHGNMADWTQFNNIDGKTSYRWEWYQDMKTLTWQPYLLFVTKQICRALGYTYDFSQWEKYDSLRYLLICNTLPPSYGLKNFARALPHWSVNEFFQQLELFMGGDFSVDHRAKTVKFNYWRELAQRAGKVSIDKVLEEHSVSVSLDDADCDYLGAKDIKYADNGGSDWKYLCCPDFVDVYKQYFENSSEEERKDRLPIISYSTLDAMLGAVKEFYRFRKDDLSGDYSSRRRPPFDAILYCRDCDQYFILYEYRHENIGNSWFSQYCDLLPLNIFGDRILDKDNAKEVEELKITPARVGRYNASILVSSQRHMLYLQPKSFEADVERQLRGNTISDLNTDIGSKPWPQQALDLQAEKTEAPEYYDKIYIAWYSGWQKDTRMDKINGNENDDSWPSDYLPYPEISEFSIHENLASGSVSPFSLRLNANSYMERTGLQKVDPLTKATFKFISDNIPSPRATFYIRGKRYLCGKITATFTENGMSQLLSGEFYPIAE